MANPIIRIKRGSSTPVSLSSGELAIDLTNLNLFVGKADGTALAVGGEGTFATKSYADSIVSSANSNLSQAIADEQTARIAADGVLTTNLNNEISRATAAEGVIASNLATEISDRTDAVSAEATARANADTALDNKITTEKGRIDAILSAADADKDSFAEIVTIINSIDTANDSAFASYVLSNNAALAQEVTDRTNADTALGIRIDGVESDGTALEARVSTAETEIDDLQTKTQNIDLAGTTLGTTKFNGTIKLGDPTSVGASINDNGTITAVASGGDKFFEASYSDGIILGPQYNSWSVQVRNKLEGVEKNGSLPTIENFVIDGGVY